MTLAWRMHEELHQQRPAKKFKRDASLSEFEAGAKTNRETLLAAAQKCGVHATCRSPVFGRKGGDRQWQTQDLRLWFASK